MCTERATTDNTESLFPRDSRFGLLRWIDARSALIRLIDHTAQGSLFVRAW